MKNENGFRASRVSCHLHRLKSSPCVTSLLLCSAPWERTRSPPPTWRRSSPLSELRRTKRGWPRCTSLSTLLAFSLIKHGMVNQVVAACKGKSTEELIAAGLPKLASMGELEGGCFYVSALPDKPVQVVVELLLLLPLLPVVLLLRRLLRRRPRRRRRRRSPRRRTMTWASDSSISRSLWPFLVLTTCYWQICWKLEIKN